MKKIAVLSILMLGLLVAGMAQNVVPIESSYDTLTNTDNGQYNIAVTTTPSMQSAIYAYSVQVINDSISGSGTTYFYLQETNDGTNWKTITTSDTDSLSFTADGTGVLPKNTTGFLSRQLRVYASHTGTGVDRVKISVAIRKLAK